MEINKNWVKSGRTSKKDATNIVVNVYAHAAGQLGEASWDDYLQLKIYDKEDSRFLRLTMTPSEAEELVNKLQLGLNKIQEPATKVAQ